ncbi:unnamed protein product [Rotaria sordida]|uniref:Uncharacterized protein n=1 Tax=Rotaria sordida TaxID=392033 RepID=A0A819UPJ2_9BILA|nr:unnamed protein product [Rotaria sordida]
MIVQPANNNGAGPDNGATAASASIPLAIAILVGILLSPNVAATSTPFLFTSPLPARVINTISGVNINNLF